MLAHQARRKLESYFLRPVTERRREGFGNRHAHMAARHKKTPHRRLAAEQSGRVMAIPLRVAPQTIRRSACNRYADHMPDGKGDARSGVADHQLPHAREEDAAAGEERGPRTDQEQNGAAERETCQHG